MRKKQAVRNMIRLAPVIRHTASSTYRTVAKSIGSVNGRPQGATLLYPFACDARRVVYSRVAPCGRPSVYSVILRLCNNPGNTRYKCYSAMLLACILLAFLPLSVRADGGAPNLAYVAGAGRGIEVIDITQQKILHNFSVAGDPHMVLLSPDGGILYVTQPMLGQVSELAAKTGRILCTISIPGHPSLLALST